MLVLRKTVADYPKGPGLGDTGFKGPQANELKNVAYIILNVDLNRSMASVIYKT